MVYFSNKHTYTKVHLEMTTNWDMSDVKGVRRIITADCKQIVSNISQLILLWQFEDIFNVNNWSHIIIKALNQLTSLLCVVDFLKNNSWFQICNMTATINSTQKYGVHVNFQFKWYWSEWCYHMHFKMRMFSFLITWQF